MKPERIQLTIQQSEALRLRWGDWEVRFLAAMLGGAVATVLAVVLIR